MERAHGTRVYIGTCVGITVFVLLDLEGAVQTAKPTFPSEIGNMGFAAEIGMLLFQKRKK